MLGQPGEQHATIDPDGTVALYRDPDQPVDPTTLRDVLASPTARVWSGVTVGGEESFDGVWLRLTATEPGTCRIHSAAPPPTTPVGSSAQPGTGRLALSWTDRFCQQIRARGDDRAAEPAITAYPAAAQGGDFFRNGGEAAQQTCGRLLR